MTVDALSPATELALAVRRKEVKSRELLDLYLDRIGRLDKAVNAVVTLDVDRARAAADAADAATARGGVDPVARPFHGLPITIKDAIATAGIRSTGGAVELRDHVPEEDAPVVAKLKGAGAIVFGKTNLPRWSGDGQSYNEMFGTTNNPFDAAAVPGGSSGGAAAAVAMGFTAFEIGTDIGGSVRIPSHFCGTFGLKPSFGVVPQRGYLDHAEGGVTDADINVFGPITRSADDLAAVMAVITGPPPEYEPAVHVELPRPSLDSLAGLRVGAWFDQDGLPVDAEYRALLQRTADAMADAGATVVDHRPDVDFDEEANLFGRLVDEATMLSASEKAQAKSITHIEWLRLDHRRAALRRVWHDYFTTVDVLVCPVTLTPAFPHQQDGDMFSRTATVNGETVPYIKQFRWTGFIGVVGLPSAVAPIGLTSAGLPVGVQIVSPFLHDLRSVAVAGLVGRFVPPPAAVAHHSPDALVPD
jgi:amidase